MNHRGKYWHKIRKTTWLSLTRTLVSLDAYPPDQLLTKQAVLHTRKMLGLKTVSFLCQRLKKQKTKNTAQDLNKSLLPGFRFQKLHVVSESTDAVLIFVPFSSAWEFSSCLLLQNSELSPLRSAFYPPWSCAWGMLLKPIL